MSVLRGLRLGPDQGLYTYCSFTLVVTLSGLPSGSVLSQGWLTVKNSPQDADGSAVLAKNITTTLVAGVGQITDTGASDQSGSMTFLFSAAQMAALTANQSYAWDCKVMYDTGEVLPVVEDSQMTPGQAITRDYT